MLDGLWYDESNQTVSAEKFQVTAIFERSLILLALPSHTTISKTMHLKRGAFFCNGGRRSRRKPCKAWQKMSYSVLNGWSGTLNITLKRDFSIQLKTLWTAVSVPIVNGAKSVIRRVRNAWTTPEWVQSKAENLYLVRIQQSKAVELWSCRWSMLC